MRVFAAGTFDGLHPGHVAFLQFAKSLGGELFVVVARDGSVKKTKGKAPYFNEKERLTLVSSLRVVDKALLGSKKSFMASVEKVKPQIIVLGHDQEAAWLAGELRKRNIHAIVMRAKKYNRAKYSMKSVKKKNKHFGKKI